MSRIAPWKIASVVSLGALLVFAGCASEIDDPEDSSSILVVEAVEPSLVAVDVEMATPFTAKTVSMKLSSIPRGSATASDLSDIIIESYSVVYNPPLSTGTASASFATTLTVPAGGSGTLIAIIVPVADLQATITAGTSSTATIQVHGHDILGDPASAEGFATLIFDNVPNNN